MANLQVTFFAPSIMRFTTFQMALPNDTPPAMKEGNSCYGRPMKTLFLLHGFSGCSLDWVTGSLINELAGKYNLAVVMPSGDNSFYLNGAGSCNKYEDFLCGDLISYIRDTFGLAKTPEDTIIGGLSMGGFGAIRSALAHPDVFGKMFGLSSALICDTIQGMEAGTADGIADYDYYRQVFGDLDRLAESPKNPKYLVEQRLEKGEKIQPVYMACGSEDFLIENNRDFHEFLVQHGVDVTYRESPGVHEWKFWNEYIEPAIEWALDE